MIDHGSTYATDDAATKACWPFMTFPSIDPTARD